MGDDSWLAVSPPVLGCEESDDVCRVAVEGLTYIPVHSASLTDDSVYAEVRIVNDGMTALFAYSSLDELVAHCGEAQPWAAVKSHHLNDVASGEGVDAVFWDVELPELQRRCVEEGSLKYGI